MCVSKKLFLLPFVILCASCLAPVSDRDRGRAVFTFLSWFASDNDRQPLLKTNITLRVLDEEGEPVPNAMVKILDEARRGDDYRVWTDEYGMCEIRAVIFDTFGCAVLAPGYWMERGVLFSTDPSCASLFTRGNGTVGPTNEYTIRMTRIRMPENDLVRVDCHKTQAGVHRMDLMRIPELDRECPFDLETGDWLPPFGNGVIADVMVLSGVSETGEPWVRWRFPNPLDGAMSWADTRNFPLDPDAQPEPHEAPESGYEQEFVFHGGGVRFFDGESDRWRSIRIPTFVFRFRCQEDGGVLTGLHGFWPARTYSVRQYQKTNGVVRLATSGLQELFVNPNRESRLLYGREAARKYLPAPGYRPPRRK